MKDKNRVGLGTFPLASVFNKITKANAKKVVEKFLNEDGYYIDTAPMYGFGEVEFLLGEVFKGYKNRDNFHITTKCGYVDVEGKNFQTIKKSGKYEDVICECERSLKRLKLDYIDLYFVHSPDPNTPFGETMEALIKLQEQGKIKEIGVSNVNLEELKIYNDSGKVKFIQNRFSLINRSISKNLASYLLENNIKLVPYQVIDRGQLTGSVLQDLRKLREGDLRVGRSDWLPDKLDIISDWIKESLLPIAQKLGITLGQLSIAWALHQEYLGFVIVGVTNSEYIPINLKANSIKLTKENISEIDNAYLNLEKIVKQKYNLTIREFRGLNEKYY